MKTLIQTLFLTLIIIGFSACSPKLTVKSLYPSSMPDEKLNVLHIEKFKNDRIYQKEKIEEKLSNMTLDQKRVFRLKNSPYGVDAIIKGRVLESSLNYDIYHKKSLHKKCKLYKYNKEKKINECVKYYYRFIPCEDRKYKVRTKVKVISAKNDSILLSKIYEKTRSINKCFENYDYTRSNYSRNKYQINSKLADEISYAILNDLSPHYRYFNLEIIDEFEEENIKFSQKQALELENISSLIEDNNLALAQKKLYTLDRELKGKSWEVLYNLALTYEGQNKLFKAKQFYEKALEKTKDSDNYRLVNNSIKRVQRNLEENIKARSQLP